MKKIVIAIVGVIAVGAIAIALFNQRAAEQFAGSESGGEAKELVEACIQMKKDGQLPGLPAGEQSGMEISSEGIELTESDEVSYPLEMNCLVDDGDTRHTFPFVRQAPESEWTLVGGDAPSTEDAQPKVDE